MSEQLNRRRFLSTAAAAGVGISLAGSVRQAAAAGEKPALLGGKRVRTQSFPSWPVQDKREEQALLDVLHSGDWYRGGGKYVDAFEKAYCELTGSKHCVATANGTSSLFASLGALGVGPGDEVIVPPYTFVATVNVVMLHFAMPIFVDTDPETFQIDPRKIEAAITDRTVAIVPVHIGGYAADMDAIMDIARKRKLPVVEDACQAHLGEWRGKKLGTVGDTGCFSFQASKNLNSGEGGAILTQNDDLAAGCYAFHNNSRAPKIAGYHFNYLNTRASNLRMTEFQGNLLLAQMTRVEEQSDRRRDNGDYLSTLLAEIPGIAPAKKYGGCTRSAYHLYMFRYHPEQFAGLSRGKFIQALGAEGIPASGGYSPLNTESFILETLKGRGYQRVYGEKAVAQWPERTRCPENDKLCEEAVWFTQNMLLGPRSDMDQIAEAIRKIRAHAGELAKA
ncbi:MAG: DegT/DnrJ/EryC1/StrS family aminotransferase [Pirellulales bacterium]|nr:DegT/DnrJ/EryC1/StrS family aminotransferase [Pirellulales bacterium]